MKSNRPTQAARSAATREALVTAARALFAERGYVDVGTEEIVRAAGLTRGALYHHFADKVELFAATFEAVETDTTARIVAAVAEAGLSDPLAAMRAGASAFFDTCTDPKMARIMLLDAPSVLGWERFGEISNRYSMGLIQSLLGQAIEVGLGALREAALYLARADEHTQARIEVGAVMDRLIASLAAD
jgi:AcrR family transcriptional regulator